MSLASRSTRSAIFLSASGIINIGIGFLGGVVLARLLQPNDFGTFALALTLVAFADLRSKLQLEQKFIRDQDDRKEYLDTFFTLNLGMALISFLIFLVASAIIVALNRTDLALCLILLGALGLLDPLSSAIRVSIEKNIAFRAISFIQTVTMLTQFTTTLTGAWLGLGLWSLVLGQVVAALLGLALFLRVAPRCPSLRLNRALAGDLIAYGIKYGLVYAISAITLTQFDNFIVGLLNGTFALGFYDRAYRTSLWPTLLVSASIGRITLPTYSKLQENPSSLGRAFSVVLWMLLTVTMPLAVFVVITAPDLVPLLYGEKWLPSVPILQMLAAFAVLRPLWDDMVSVLVATKRSGQMARVVFAQAIALITFATPLTWFYGAVGTAFGVGVAFLISGGFLLYFGYRHLSVRISENVALPVFNNFAALTIYLVFRAFFPFDSFAPVTRILIAGMLFGMLYFGISILTSRQIIFRRAHYVIQLVRG